MFNDSTTKIVSLVATVDAAHLDYLAVVLHSALAQLSAGWRLRVFIIGYDIHAAAKRTMEQCCARDRLQIEWLGMDLEMIRGRWPGATGGGVVLYYRLYLAEALPPALDRVLFLDADVLVTGDLATLWQSSFEGMTVQAVPDAYGDAVHLPRLRTLDLPDGIRFGSSAPYFNAGVLLIDLERWRRERVGTRAASLMWTHGERLLGRDQDALNCVLVGRWKPLSVAWNFHELPNAVRQWRAPADTPETLRAAILNPGILHFIGCKPWEPDCVHSGRERWRSAARAVGAPVPPDRFVFRWFQGSLYDLDWGLRRGLVQARDRARIASAARLLLVRPWLLLVYPIWAIWRGLRRTRRRVAGAE